ncbi:MAG: ABC transporter substrate-binding protein [Candidatus Hydrogenedentes bacterium]|nr:ABC transporter substrate-binding protein [Candidatus Hydrogenedentota bacterium]
MTNKLITGLVALAFVTGCGGQVSAPSKPGDAAAPKTASPAPAAEKPAPQALTIAVVPKGLTHQFWQTVHAGAEAAAKEVNAKIIWKGPAKETEIAEQITILEDVINSRVSGIVMAACDQNALVDVLKKAADAKIPVATMDSGVQSDLPITFVATDNIAGAKAAAKELARLIGAEGKVGLIPFVQGAATSDMREQGFKEGLKDYPNIELAPPLYCKSDVAVAMSVTEDMLTSHPDLKGIFAANEPGALGAAAALQSAGKTGEIKLVAFDASDEQIEALKKGTIQALVVQNPFQMGYKGVKAVTDHLAGKPVEKRIDTGVTVVTMENFTNPDIQKLLYPLK